MLIRQDLQPAWPSALELRRCIAAQARGGRVAPFKVGMTCDVDERAALYRRLAPGYGELVVLGQTGSETQMRETERELRQWYPGDFDGMQFGSIGTDGPPPYFVYVALG